MNQELAELLEIARSAARLAAAVHRRALVGDVKPDTKSSLSDLVTEVDRDTERELVRVIRAARPTDEISERDCRT